MEKHNFQDKRIQEFTSEDTLYFHLVEKGYSYCYLCKFIKFEKGKVHGEIVDVLSVHEKSMIGKIISTSLTNCSLYDGEFYHHRYFSSVGIVV